MKPIVGAASVTPIGEARSRKTAGTPAAAKKIVGAEAGGVEAALPRDRWNRPLIIPVGGGKPVPFRRASTVCEVLEDHFGLHKWQLRLTAQGLAARPDLVQSIHVAKTVGEIGGICEQAMDHAGSSTASRNGTTLHALTEGINNGAPLPKGLPNNIRAMLDAYIDTLLADFEVLDTERFVVCDAIQVGGTYDLRLRHRETGMVVIGDLKTGQKMKYLALKAPAQVAVYAAGVWYDLDAEREPTGADRDHGLLVHLPWVDDASDATCELRWMDLRIGRKTIKKAMEVEQFRKFKHTTTMPAYKGAPGW